MAARWGWVRRSPKAAFPGPSPRRWRGRGSGRLARPTREPGPPSGTWLALVYAAGANREPRLVAPLLPVAALLAARAAISFHRGGPSGRGRGPYGAGLAVCADRTIPGGPDRALAFNGAPQADRGWDRGALVDAVAGSDGRIAAVALEDARLNANNLSSLAAARGLDLKFVSLGYAQVSAEGALIRLKDKSCDRLVLIEGVPESELPAFLNRANAGIRAMTFSGRLKTKPLARLTLAPGVTATVLRLIW